MGQLHSRQASTHEQALQDERRRAAALKAELAEARRPKFSEETRRIAEAAYAKLSREEKVALRHLVVAGDMPDRKALDYLHTRGMAINYASIFSGLSRTPLVQRVLQGRQPGEGVSGYTGNYTVSPKFREVIELLVENDPEAQ